MATFCCSHQGIHPSLYNIQHTNKVLIRIYSRKRSRHAQSGSTNVQNWNSFLEGGLESFTQMKTEESGSSSQLLPDSTQTLQYVSNEQQGNFTSIRNYMEISNTCIKNYLCKEILLSDLLQCTYVATVCAMWTHTLKLFSCMHSLHSCLKQSSCTALWGPQSAHCAHPGQPLSLECHPSNTQEDKVDIPAQAPVLLLGCKTEHAAIGPLKQDARKRKPVSHSDHLMLWLHQDDITSTGSLYYLVATLKPTR